MGTSTHYRKKVIQGSRGNNQPFESLKLTLPCHVSVIPGTSVPNPKFVAFCGGHLYEPGFERTLETYDSSVVLVRKFS